MDGRKFCQTGFLQSITLDVAVEPGHFIGGYIRADLPMGIAAEQVDLPFLPIDKSFVRFLLDLLDIRIGSIFRWLDDLSFGDVIILTGYLRGNLTSNEIRNAGKCRHDGQ